ncbi:MAG: hypothetical protein ABI401_14285 [Candidatus Dormibacter sp.]
MCGIHKASFSIRQRFGAASQTAGAEAYKEMLAHSNATLGSVGPARSPSRPA